MKPRLSYLYDDHTSAKYDQRGIKEEIPIKRFFEEGRVTVRVVLIRFLQWNDSDRQSMGKANLVL